MAVRNVQCCRIFYKFVKDTPNCRDYVFEQAANTSNSLNFPLTNSHSDCLMGLSHKDGLIFSNLLILGNNLKLMTLLLIACVCRYLTARYARKTWIQHNKIPYIITLTVAYIFITQLSSLLHCYTLLLLVRWIQWAVFVSVIAFVIYQSRKLLMVINWTIVDLEISQNNQGLLVKFKQMYKRVKKISTLVWIASICYSFSILLTNIGLVIAMGLLISRYGTTHDNSPYIASVITTGFDISSTVLYVVSFIILMGPFLGNGLVAISVLTCRCIRGKTGYKTHFPNPLRTKLIISTIEIY